MLFLKFPSLFSSAAPSRLSGFEQSAEELILPFAKHTAGALQILGHEEQPQPWAVPLAPCWCSVFSSAAAAFVRVPQQPHVIPQSPGRLLRGAGSLTADNGSSGLAWSRSLWEASKLTSKYFLPVPEAAFEVLCPSHRPRVPGCCRAQGRKRVSTIAQKQGGEGQGGCGHRVENQLTRP